MTIASRSSGAPSLVVDQPSALAVDTDGKLRVRLIQADTGQAGFGERPLPAGLQVNHTVTPEQLAIMRLRLKSTEVGALNLLSYHPALAHLHKDVRRSSKDRTIVALAGIDGAHRNQTWIAENGEILTQAKLSLASDDIAEGVVPGDTLRIFSAAPGSDKVSWAMLNCHDYTDVRLLKPLLAARIELLVVVAYNNATGSIGSMQRPTCTGFSVS